MGSDVVVVAAPELQFSSGVISRIEDLLIQYLVSQASIEAFDEAILLGFAGIDIMPIHAVIASPLQDRATCELCAVTPSE